MSWGSFSNPLVGAFGKLIRDAIQSANYVATLLGWRIAQNGDAEFNQGSFRSTVVVNGPHGTHIDINPSSGDPVIYFYPDLTGPPPAVVGVVPGVVYVFTEDAAAQQYEMVLASPNPFSGSPAEVILLSSNASGTVEQTVQINGIMLDKFDSMIYLRGLCGNAQVIIGNAVVNITTPGTTFHFPFPFPTGVIPNVHINMNTGVANSGNWTVRALNISEVGFDIRAFGPSTTGFTLTFQWTALID